MSQAIPYCQPQANPHEGSMNRQIYIVKAPLIGYRTAISASACIIRYLTQLSGQAACGLGVRASIHHGTYCEPVRFVISSWIAGHSPMMIKPRTTEPGPPVWKALAVPTKRPAPMAPPLRSKVSVCPGAILTLDALEQRGRESLRWKDVHGDHLHVSPFEISVQRGSSDHALTTVLSAIVIGRYGRAKACPLLRVREDGTVFARTHLGD